MLFAQSAVKYLDKLDVTQNIALRLILGAPDFTATVDMHVEAEVHPLALRRTEAMARAYSRIVRRPTDDPIRQLWKKWIDDTSGRPAPRPISVDPFRSFEPDHALHSPFEGIRAVSRALALDIDEQGAELLVAFSPYARHVTTPPHSNHPDDAARDWPILGQASTRTQEDKTEALEYSASITADAFGSCAGRTVVFSDGSAHTDHVGGGGSAFVVASAPLAAETYLFAGGCMATNFGMELIAVKLALEHSLNWDFQRLTVLTDCQQAATTSRSESVGPDGAYWSVVQRISAAKRTLRDRGGQVTIDWVPGHCGCPYNDKADELANAASSTARLSRAPSPDFPKPLCVAFHYIRLRIMNHMQQWWQRPEVHGNRMLRSIQPEVTRRSVQELLASLTRAEQTCVERVRLGTTMTNDRRSSLGYTNSKICSHCPATDSANHRLFHCTHYSDSRKIFLAELQLIKTDAQLTHSSVLKLTGADAKQKKKITKALGEYIINSKLHSTFIYTDTTHSS